MILKKGFQVNVTVKRIGIEIILRSYKEVQMKKIILVLIITALSLSVTAAVVSADYECLRGFRGVYEMSLTGSCLHSIDGFGEGPPYIPIGESGVWAATMMAHGTWMFNRDGTGSAKGLNYVIDFPPGIPGPGSMARGNPFELHFTYYVTHRGVITVILDDAILEGRVSIDKKTISLPSAYQEYNLVEYGLGYAVCNAARVLIRVKKIPDKE